VTSSHVIIAKKVMSEPEVKVTVNASKQTTSAVSDVSSATHGGFATLRPQALLVDFYTPTCRLKRCMPHSLLSRPSKWTTPPSTPDGSYESPRVAPPSVNSIDDNAKNVKALCK
jgi:hypothetical protein